ncbi:MAG: hypothetical protein IT377_32695 [Polyangiaceae bacterium]|nr:hypothetical protein [Polyangiaceae bacterium]
MFLPARARTGLPPGATRPHPGAVRSLVAGVSKPKLAPRSEAAVRRRLDRLTIVYSNREWVTGDRKLSVGGRVISETFLRAGFPEGYPATLRAVEVDSSWGAGEAGHPEAGVKRELWVQNQANGLWGYWDNDGAFRVSSGPYDHPIDGVYRGKDEP